jgi:hypothetical protein
MGGGGERVSGTWRWTNILQPAFGSSVMRQLEMASNLVNFGGAVAAGRAQAVAAGA